MTTPAFEKTIERVLGHEGGFQKHPGDRGNWTGGKIRVGKLKGTKWGLSAMTYPHLDIENLTREQAKKIYFEDWWLALGLQRFPMSVGYQLFDASVNHGSHNAIGMLQRAIGVPDDGKIGPVTIGSMRRFDEADTLFRFLAERLDFMTYLGGWFDFGRGWARRIAQNLRYAAEDTP